MVEFITMAPTSGDGRYVGYTEKNSKWKNIKESVERPPSFDYIASVAKAAEKAGFSTLLLPTGEACLDSITVASKLTSHTSTLKFLFAVRPGSMHPAIFAKQFATISDWSNGRALVNIVTGGSPKDLASQGDFLDHTTRYHRTREYIQILKKLFSGETISHQGEFYELKEATLKPTLTEVPPIYFGGSSEIGKDVASSEADVYMLWGETLAQTMEQIEDMKQREIEKQRSLSYSISFQVILGDTEEEALRNAEKLVSKIDPAVIEEKKEAMKQIDSVGVRRLYDLMESSKDNHYFIDENIWAGLATVLPGNSISLVGTPEQVSDRLIEFIELGFDKVLLRGFPHLETIEELGEKVLPLVKEKLAKKQAVLNH